MEGGSWDSEGCLGVSLPVALPTQGQEIERIQIGLESQRPSRLQVFLPVSFMAPFSSPEKGRLEVRRPRESCISLAFFFSM